MSFCPTGPYRLIERTHAVVPLRTRTLEPVDGAVGSGNKAVGAGGEVDDDFPLASHGATGSGHILTRSTLGFPSEDRGKFQGQEGCPRLETKLNHADYVS
jgi:hypothetical protein